MARLHSTPTLPKHMYPFSASFKSALNWSPLLKQLENMLGRQRVSQSGAKRHILAKKVSWKADCRFPN